MSQTLHLKSSYRIEKEKKQEEKNRNDKLRYIQT